VRHSRRGGEVVGTTVVRMLSVQRAVGVTNFTPWQGGLRGSSGSGNGYGEGANVRRVGVEMVVVVVVVVVTLEVL